MNRQLFFSLIFSVIAVVSFFQPCKIYSQEVYKHISYVDIYDFLDELANAHIISINSAVKPYSRMLIAEKLNETNGKKELLNGRQRKELFFYLRDYQKELNPDKNFYRRHDLLYYKDSLFSLTLNPILGFSNYMNDTVNLVHTWNGAEAFAYAGKKFGLYASVRYNHENKRLTGPAYLNRFPGAVYKADGIAGGGDYSDIRGGITYTWSWGSLGLIKDNFMWGDNYHGSNILSGHTPSFTHLRIHLHPVRWLDFHHVHGGLVSEMIDSANSYFNPAGYRLVFFPKYLAANLLTITPWKNFGVSIGNSVIYSDKSVQPAYLIPSQGGELFLNISSRQIRNVHLYTSFFVDEISFNQAFDKTTQSNFMSGKTGMRVSNMIVQDLFLTAEYTRTNPIAYRHYTGTNTFASDGYNLGHYLGDNAQEIFLSASYKPLAKLCAEISYSVSQKGEEYPYTSQAGAGSGSGIPFMKVVHWKATEFGAKAQYQVINDCYVFAGIIVSDHHGVDVDVYTQPYFREKRTTINIGANVGF